MVLLSFSSYRISGVLEVLLLQLGYFQLLGPEFFTKYFLVNYGFLKIHLKLLDVIFQILVIHQLRLKLHILLIGVPLALLSSNISDELHA